MSRGARLLLGLVIVLGTAVLAVAGEDLRAQYGTKSLEAARQISKAMALKEEGKVPAAREAIEAAIQADPQCQLAHHWLAGLLSDLGEVDEAKKTYQRTFAMHKPGEPLLVTVDAAINLGLTLGKLKEHDESNIWFTKAIVVDPQDRAGLRWKAYRNMAINLGEQGRFLSAALAAGLGHEANPKHVEERMVPGFLNRAGGQEVAQVLHFEVRAPKVSPREAPAELTPVPINKEKIPEKIGELHPQPQGRYVVAIPAEPGSATATDPKQRPHYYLIRTTDGIAIERVAVASPICCACIAGGHLYLVTADPPKLQRVEPATGNVLATFPLGGMVPRSIAVLPARGLAFFPIQNEIHGLDLQDGGVFATGLPGQHVAAEATERFVFSFTKPPFGAPGAGMHRYQSTLFKSFAVPGGLLPAECRDNAASNAYRVLVSGDGHWVAVPGGGGWRPQADKGKGSGYGVAVFSAHNLDHVQGFFRTDAYPTGGAFNPVTGQFAAVRDEDASVYHLTDPKNPSVLKGDLSGVCAWSGGGDYLILANGDQGGITVYANPLTAAEKKIAATWWKDIETQKTAEAAAPAAPALQPVAWLAAFAVKGSRADAQQALARAVEEGRTERRPGWRAYPPYGSNAQAVAFLSEVIAELNKADDVGIAIYRLKKVLKADPDFVPAKYHLARALQRTGQVAQARAAYEAVVRADAGRTQLSCLALNGLGELLTQEDKPLAAIYCLALSARLDKANPHTLELLVPLLKQNQFDTEATKLSRAEAVVPTPAAGLPKLPLPTGPDAKLTASEIFAKAVNSVVLIRVGRGTGTGMCIGEPGVILTNHHIVADSAPVSVHPFQLEEGKVQRMPGVQARLLHSDPKHDIAVLKLSSVPATMRPLAVAAGDPKTGETVFAIGNPGLGAKILEQSISEGIVSSNRRLLAGVSYIQHTAAVNPGNSGGPLLNDCCWVVGMNTLKTSLQGVYFAIPVGTIRSVFGGE